MTFSQSEPQPQDRQVACDTVLLFSIFEFYVVFSVIKQLVSIEFFSKTFSSDL